MTKEFSLGEEFTDSESVYLTLNKLDELADTLENNLVNGIEPEVSVNPISLAKAFILLDEAIEKHFKVEMIKKLTLERSQKISRRLHAALDGMNPPEIAVSEDAYAIFGLRPGHHYTKEFLESRYKKTSQNIDHFATFTTNFALANEAKRRLDTAYKLLQQGQLPPSDVNVISSE